MSKITDERLAGRLEAHAANLREVVRGFTPWIDQSDARIIVDDVAAAANALRSQSAGVRAGTANPTEAMIAAGLRVDFDNEDERATVVNIWNVMSAALEPRQEEAGYKPKLVEYDGEGEPYAEFVSADEPTVTRTGFAGELLLSLDRSKLLGIRVYTTPTQKEQESQRVSENDGGRTDE